MIKKLITLVLFSGLLLCGCTKEDLSDCGGVEVAFKYDYNTEMTDKFPSDVHKINLFLFDDNGHLVGEYVDEGGHLDNTYRLRLNVRPGIYDLVAWGNLSDHYHTTKLTPGVSTKEEFLLAVKSNQGTVEAHPEHMYYGSRMRVEVKSSGNQVILVSMIKNTNYVKAIFKGLPTGVSRAADGTQFLCRITGVNSTYSYDNSLFGIDRLLYVPQYTIGVNLLSAEYITMRLFDDNSCQTRIILEHLSPDGTSSEEVFNIKLTDAIKAQYPDVDFDRDDTFILPFEVDYTNGNFTITINGWTVTGSGQVIG